MSLSTIVALVRSGHLPLLAWVAWSARTHYRLAFVAGGLSSGLFGRLAAGPVRFDVLEREFSLRPCMRDGFKAWLDLGVALGELRFGPEGYDLRRRRTRKLLRRENDVLAAILQETAMLAGSFVSQGPMRFISGNANSHKLFTMADQNGPLVARTSRFSEPFICEALEPLIPRRGAFKLFEIGCGAAAYIRYAAERNPDLTALGLELQPDVADAAKINIAKWNLASRVTIEAGDIMQRKPDAVFDLATLHQNIYYFPVECRVAVLAHVKQFLKPGGRVLLTTCCKGGAAGAALLDFWAAMTEGCGRLPDIPELAAQLEQAGFRHVTTQKLIPGEHFYAFVATAQ